VALCEGPGISSGSSGGIGGVINVGAGTSCQIGHQQLTSTFVDEAFPGCVENILGADVFEVSLIPALWAGQCPSTEKWIALY
jgi:hypothetical protein